MGPRLNVDNETFLKELSQNPSKVIRGPKILWTGHTYLICGKEFYFYTIAKAPLELPKGIEVTDVKQIIL